MSSPFAPLISRYLILGFEFKFYRYYKNHRADSDQGAQLE